MKYKLMMDDEHIKDVVVSKDDPRPLLQVLRDETERMGVSIRGFNLIPYHGNSKKRLK